jgi:prepilin-type N-terminal cleavage/methylation domain-containing protein
MTMINGTRRSRGFTLVELLVYIAVMTVVLGALTYFVSNVYGLYINMTTEARADRAASALMQVLATEMRSGESIDQSASTFGVADGMLTIDAREDGASVEKVFTVTDGRAVFSDGGGEAALTPSDMTVSTFRFDRIATPVSYAVRYEIALTFTKDGAPYTKTYPGVVILRYSYD